MINNDASLSPTPSNFTGSDLPVEQVSWDDVQIFLERLNEQEADNLPPGWAYVLPTEAQWEYACRAGTTTAYSNANYNGMRSMPRWPTTIPISARLRTPAPAGRTPRNKFFDLHGNVWEWCGDLDGPYEVGPLTDPVGSTSGINRVKRGGSWISEPLSLRSAMRPVGSYPATRSATHGFRLSYRQITNPPTNLNTVLSLSIAENQPVGSFIGTFTSTDVDSNPTLSYYLINGAGDTDNSLFALETNGTLKTATTFDYESNASTYSIRVQVRDEFNATVEGNFTVSLTNANEPPSIGSNGGGATTSLPRRGESDRSDHGERD